MIKVCRLSISGDGNMRDVLNSALEQAEIVMADIELNGPDYGSKTHFGNWVLTPVLDNEAAQKLADQLGTKLDNHRSYIEQSDIDGFNIGDKVSIKYRSDLGFACAHEGKVLRKNDNELTILKKRSRTKGWTFKPWDEVTIETI